MWIIHLHTYEGFIDAGHNTQTCTCVFSLFFLALLFLRQHQILGYNSKTWLIFFSSFLWGKKLGIVIVIVITFYDVYANFSLFIHTKQKMFWLAQVSLYVYADNEAMMENEQYRQFRTFFFDTKIKLI
jgi:hypothetical protein